jgi:hypothetical protein
MADRSRLRVAMPLSLAVAVDDQVVSGIVDRGGLPAAPADTLDTHPRCSSCNHPITDRRNFCGECGAALSSLRSVMLDRTSIRGG